ncbi:MAG: hypothetical protein J6Z11_05090 [Candidatus Riflebacteria bacterium]|nr:hypothetical protein [Candidatus Riflebacteria bacterium]
MKIYLDNCCYNRPYDNQSFIKISLEAQCKLFIQNLIKNKKLELVTSYMLMYENSLNPFPMRKQPIEEFINKNTSVFIPYEKHDIIEKEALLIMDTGIKYKDACHIACSMLGQCNYFITTDIRLLKYKTNKIIIINPVDFVKNLEE